MHQTRRKNLNTHTHITFNSLYLGFFHAPSDAARLYHYQLFFQFPLLGIFPCTRRLSRGETKAKPLSIPFTWDFSMHRRHSPRICSGSYSFQFPLLGIFPCTKLVSEKTTYRSTSFQFPLLGIFPCTGVRVDIQTCKYGVFQFPLLGIFPCTGKLDGWNNGL